MSIFFKLTSSENKETDLLQIISKFRSNSNSNNAFIVEPDEFKLIPGLPFAYWVSHDVRSAYQELNLFESNNRTAKQGLATSDDFRFVRTSWETSDIDWKPFAKGGEYSPYHSDIHLKVNWQAEGKEMKALVCQKYPYLKGAWGFVVKNSNYYFKPGLTWPLRTTSGFGPRIMPAGCAFGHKGPAIFVEADSETDLLVLQGILSSTAYKYVLSLQLAAADAAARSYEVGLIQKTPIPELADDSKKIIKEVVFEAWNLTYSYDFVDETANAFILPELLLEKWFDYSIKFINKKLEQIQCEVNRIGFEEYKFKQQDIENALIREGTGFKPRKINTQKEKEYALLSWCVGSSFGYLKEKSVESISLEKRNPLEAIKYENKNNSNSSNTIKDNILTTGFSSDKDLGSRVDIILTNCDEQTSINVSKWLNTEFFKYHLKTYTKSRRAAPLVWPLETVSSNYKVWLYAHKLSMQTLLTCINEFIEPEIEDINTELHSLMGENSRSQAQELKVDSLTNNQIELSNLKEEMLRISKFWQPNLQDGVQITAAPLWRLFQHKAWQKKLKQTWEKLEEGEYDWAHLAFSAWPERVLKKCHEDRSLAIAHNVETDLWHEVEVIKGKKKELVWEWQPKPLSDAELHAYIREKIASDDRLKLYRSNQSANANGGAL